MTRTHQIVTIKDRNEAKYLVALGFSVTPSPRTSQFVDFDFEATNELFEARRSYSLNHCIPILTLFRASEYVDNIIADHRRRSAVGGSR